MENTSLTDFLTEAIGKWTKLSGLIGSGLSGISVNKTASKSWCVLCLIPSTFLVLNWIFIFIIIPSNYPWHFPQTTLPFFSPGLPFRGAHQ